MRVKQHYDIAIIGQGITGLSTAYHLQKAGTQSLCLLADGPSQSEKTAGMLCGGLIDNFTRILQRHGPIHAKAVWDYSLHAVREVEAFAHAQQIPLRQGQRLRLIVSHDEWIEAEKAAEALEAHGFRSSLASSITAASRAQGSSTRLLGVQWDEVPAAMIEPRILLSSLQRASASIAKHGPALSIHILNDRVTIETAAALIEAEVVILANHLNIREHLPFFQEVLVSSQDQWHRCRLDGDPLPFAPGSVLTWKHGHYWVLIEDQAHIRIGGARFLRPLAGFEASEEALSPKVEKHLREAWNELYPQHPIASIEESHAGLDIRPCDEVPVIGPLFGEQRVLMAAGYMGQGLSLGFAAGRSLTDLCLGRPQELPRFLWPERHRSLPMEPA